MTGQCGSCRKFYLLDHKKRVGRSLPKPELPPCAKCPKYKLHPRGFGLMERNFPAATLFNKALRQERVGMDGILVSVMTVPDAISIIEAHAHLFRNSLEALNCLDRMIALSQVVLRIWSESENKERERLQREAEAKANSPSRNRR